MLDLLLYILTGLAAGTAGGLFGVGGGIIIVPVLTLFFLQPIHLAIAVSLANSAAVALSGSVRYYRLGLLQLSVIKILIPTAIVGVSVGALLANRLPQRTLMILFSIYLILVIIQLALRIEQSDRIRPKRLAVTGTLLGFVSALLGIGGGSVAVPLQLLSGVSLKNAIANSLATIIVSASFGSIMFFVLGGGTRFDVPTAIFVGALIIPSAIVGAQIGATITGRIPQLWVRVVFIIYVIFGAVSMLRNALFLS